MEVEFKKLYGTRIDGLSINFTNREINVLAYLARLLSPVGGGENLHKELKQLLDKEEE